MATVILVYRTSGYDIDRRTGEVVLKGILIVHSVPVDASVAVDGVPRSEGVDGRISLPYGTHTVTLTSPGYQTWSKAVTIDGGSVEQVHYPRLLPKTALPVAVSSYSEKPVLASQSHDRRWILVGLSSTLLRQLQLFDTAKDDLSPITLSYSTELVAADATAASFAVEQWSEDDQHFLLSFSRPSGKEYLWVDRSTMQNSFNINQAYGVSPSRVEFIAGDANRLYIFENTGASIRTARVSDRSIATPITTSAIASYPLDESLYYATRDTEARGTAIVRVHDDSKDYILAQVPVDGLQSPVAVTYDRHQYVLISSKGASGAFVRLYRDPLATLRNGTSLLPDPLRAATLSDVQKMLISPDKRFIMIAGTDTQVVFDIERSRQYKIHLPELAADMVGLSWLDDTHLTYVRGGMVQVVEFDGLNQQAFAPALAGYHILLDRKEKRIITLTQTSEGKIVLKTVSLVAKID